MNIAIITDSDKTWLLEVYKKTIVNLKNDSHNLVGIIETPCILSKYRGKAVIFWYLRIFGLIDFIKLTLFSINRSLKRILCNKKKILSFKKLTQNYGLQHIKCLSPNDKAIVDWIYKNKIDIIISTTSFIINNVTLKAPRLGIINKHASLLPSNKGLFPYFWAHKFKKPQGVSYHLMNEDIDKGPLLHQVLYNELNNTGSMINFYRYVFKHFPDHITVAVRACVNKKVIDPIRNVSSNYFGLPTKNDVYQFRKNGGSIINWNDIYEDWKENE